MCIYNHVRRKKKKVFSLHPRGETEGTIISEYEEVGGPDDGAIFATIELDNGQTVTVKILTPEE